jgi:Zn-dependent protease
MGGLPLGRVFGTEIRAHWSWVFLLAIVTVLFGTGLSTQTEGALPAPLAWATGAAVSALIFLSVTAHELGHVAVARRIGSGRNVVVIQLLGGAYVLETRVANPGEEARLAVAGPLVSLALVVLFGGLSVALELGPAASADTPSWLVAVDLAAVTACLFNVFLGVVNLLPGYPMDGGRLVHAVAWQRTRDERAATSVVSRTGRLIGGAIMIGGAALTLLDLWAGLTLMIGGWLLIAAGRALERQGVLEDLLAGLRVTDAVDSESMVLPPQLSLDVFGPELLGPRLGSASLVGRPGETLGLIGARQVGRVPRRDWPTRRAESAMVPIHDVPRVSPQMPLWPALELLEQSGLDGLVVEPAEGAPAGEAPDLITRRSAAQIVHKRAAERAGDGQEHAGRRGSGPDGVANDAGRGDDEME